jgi:hypothetical protein
LKTRHVPPSASALISSLRGVGYSLETAIADILDNSITAGAETIDIALDWNDGNPKISILDNGCGMSEDRLVEAMRFGCRGPAIKREVSDLGRFGLGLKTASLSQSRLLTVASKQAGRIAVFSWDVDLIEKDGNGWNLIEGGLDLSPIELAPLRAITSGTLVLWRKVDFGRLDDSPILTAFSADAQRLDRHLGMVFHRFLGGDANTIDITINKKRVAPWDPFLESHEATIPQPAQRLRSPGGAISVRGFVLPHRDRFLDAAAFEEAGGPEGWNAQQGFYIYRQKRLLSAGGWLGLGGARAWTREEPSRLARIRVDIPNSADREWRIDIRKAIARPPDAIKKRLQTIAEAVRRKAREIFVYRGHFGAREPAGEVARIWRVNDSETGQRYRIDRSHDLIRLLKKTSSAGDKLLEGALDLIERTVPVERVWLDMTEHGNTMLADQNRTELVVAAAALVDSMNYAGIPFEAAVARVARMDPFDKVTNLEAELLGAKSRKIRA